LQWTDQHLASAVAQQLPPAVPHLCIGLVAAQAVGLLLLAGLGLHLIAAATTGAIVKVWGRYEKKLLHMCVQQWEDLARGMEVQHHT
jgi:hypothetical protein